MANPCRPAFSTQRELSEKSGVNLRTIQQYERRSRDINTAAGATLRALSIALSCRIEDLQEFHDTPADLRRGDGILAYEKVQTVNKLLT